MDSQLKARTHSLQMILDPIIKQVEHLEKLIERRASSSCLSSLVTAAAAVRDAVYNLTKIVNSEIAKSQDEHLKVELSMACAGALKSSEQLTNSLRQQPSLRHVRTHSLEALEGIKKGVIQVFLCWDNATIRQIMAAGQLSLDMLATMSASQSMHRLILCFRGYADAMKVLLALIDRRQKELIDPERKRKLFASLSKMKELLPQFSSAMQQYVKSHTPNSKEIKDDVCKRILNAFQSLMQSVDEQGGHENASVAMNLADVKHKLGTDRRYFIGPDLDKHIDAVIENSEAVACVSKDKYKETILNECGKVLNLQRELRAHFEALAAHPTSVQAKRAFDKCAEELCEKLNELDCFVNDSVVDQVTDTFVEPAGPINHLIQTATKQGHQMLQYSQSPLTHRPSKPSTFHTHTLDSSRIVDMGQRTRTVNQQSQTPPSTMPFYPTSHDEDESLSKQVEFFFRHSQRLNQVAACTAQRTTDTARIQLIEELADAIDKLTSAVAEKAIEVSKNPGGGRMREDLNSLRQGWAEKVQSLKKVIDEIIDPEDFITLSEANIQEDMAKCQGAIKRGNWAALHELVMKIAGKAWRVQEVGENAVDKASDCTYKAALSSAVARLEKVVPKMVSTANKLVENPSSSERHTLFINSLRELLECLHKIQSVLRTEIECTSGIDEDFLPKETSTPMHSVHKQRRLLARKQRMRRSMLLSQTKNMAPHVSNTKAARRSAEQQERSSITKGASVGVQFTGDENEEHGRITMHNKTVVKMGEWDEGKRKDPSLSGHSLSSSTQTLMLLTREKATNVSTGHFLSPNSSTSSWTIPMSPERTLGSTFSQDLLTSPVGWNHTPIPPDTITGNPPTSSPFSPHSSPPTPLSYSREEAVLPEQDDSPPTPTEVEIQAYVSLLHKLVLAAERGDMKELSAHYSSLSALIIRLVGMAESSASTLREDTELVRVIRNRSQEVSNFMPTLLWQAKVALRSKQDQGIRPWEDFRATTRKLVGCVRDLINATQQANLPWSHTARQLVKAAETGGHLLETQYTAGMPEVDAYRKNELELASWIVELYDLAAEAISNTTLVLSSPDISLKISACIKAWVISTYNHTQLEHIGTQTRRMVDIATMTLKAVAREEAIGDAECRDQELQELQEQAKTMKIKMSEITKLMPQLLEAAELALRHPLGSTSSEQLNLMSQEWATKVKVLLKGVDDITLGMGVVADTLILSVQSGDDASLQSKETTIKTLASSLHSMAWDAMEGCADEEKVRVVRVVAKKIEKLSTHLVDCANIMARTHQDEEEDEEKQTSLKLQEDAELLRREWSSQVHLLSAHIDDLTTETSAPLDRLMALSLQANETTGQAHQYLMSKFENKSTLLLEQLEEVWILFEEIMKKTVLGQPTEVAISSSRAAIMFLRNLSPHAVEAARNLATAAGAAMLEHFHHLHRQWATKAQFLLACLNKIETADVGEVTDALLYLLHDSGVTSPQIAMVNPADMSEQSSQSSQVDLYSPLQWSYSSDPITPCTRFDFEDLDLRASCSPSVELLPKKKAYIPSLPEMGLRHVQPRQKQSSMNVPLPSWAAGETNNNNITSFDSVTEVVQSLIELTDEFMEENNPMVSVGRKMSEQMTQMAEFSRGKGELQNKVDMINTAKAIAVNGKTIAKIGNLISKMCKDSHTRTNLQSCAEMIPTLSMQLTMLASVKISTSDDLCADKMLVKNAQNLMQAVIKTVQAAEAACMEGLKPLSEEDGFKDIEDWEHDHMILAMTWKRKLYHQRAKENISAHRGARGLRKLNKFRMSTPSVVDMIKSPTQH